MSRFLSSAALVRLMMAGNPHAQGPQSGAPPEFDVASIKRDMSPPGVGTGMRILPDGAVTITNQPMMTVIGYASPVDGILPRNMVGLPFRNFVQMLDSALGRQTIVDQTGLAGFFDVDLQWTPTLATAADAANAPSASDSPSIFTAVQEQLGLKLDARKMSRDVLVIDQVERPTAD